LNVVQLSNPFLKLPRFPINKNPKY